MRKKHGVVLRYAEKEIHEVMNHLVSVTTVAIRGGRGCGKTTLAQKIARERGMKFVSLEDPDICKQARRDPKAFIASLIPSGGVIDEFQKVPQLASVLERYSAADHRPGRFIVTGSVDMFYESSMNDMTAYSVDLETLSQGEIEGVGLENDFLKVALKGEPLHFEPCSRSRDLWPRILRGGYPGAALADGLEASVQWLKSHRDLVMGQYVKEHYRMGNIEKFREFVFFLAQVSGGIVDLPAWSKKFKVKPSTINRWLRILKSIYIINRELNWMHLEIPGLVGNLVSPYRVHFLDSGLLASLRGWTNLDSILQHSERQVLLKNFVYGELRRSLLRLGEYPIVPSYKHRSGAEVDFVVQIGSSIVAVDVKASPSVGSSDFAGLRHLKKQLARYPFRGDKLMSGVVFHTGDEIHCFDEQCYGVPVGRLWGQALSQKLITREEVREKALA